ncbi:MAG: Wzz/FepE/Etk N-terminal domain-containing protein, partial [Flavobacteriales bacterium]
MSAQRPQQRGSIIDAKDLRYFIRIASKNWYFVAVAIVLASVLSYLYSYKLPDVYGATTQILLKDRDVYDYQSSVYKSLGYTGVYGDIVNQRRVLTSYDLVDATLDKLDFDVSYFIVGRFKTSQVHGTLPFTVEIDGLSPKLLGKPFDLRIVDTEKFTLSYDRDGVIVTKEFAFDKEERNTDFILTVHKSPYLLDSTISTYSQTDYQFIRYARSAMVAKFISRMLVVNHEFTTILQVAVEDEVDIRAKQFLDTLSKVYIDYTLKSEVEINENTVRYIDKQLSEVSTILESHEDELQTYKENKQILDLGREENLYFKEMVDYDHQRRKWELDIGAIDALEDYVLNSEDERLLPPAVFIANDEFLKQSLGELYAMQMERNEMLYSATGSNAAVERMDSTMRLNRLNLLTYLDNSRQAILTRIADVQKQSNDYENMIRALPKSQRDVLNIQRRLQVNEKMYLFLLEKRASTIIARAGIVPGTKVIEASRSLG